MHPRQFGVFIYTNHMMFPTLRMCSGTRFKSARKLNFRTTGIGEQVFSEICPEWIQVCTCKGARYGKHFVFTTIYLECMLHICEGFWLFSKLFVEF